MSPHIEYWKQRLLGLENLVLPTDYNRSADNSHSTSILSADLGRSLSQALRSRSLEYHTSLGNVLLAGTTILLSKYTGQEDVTIGCLCGKKLLPHRAVLDDEQTFGELIKAIHQNETSDRLHGEVTVEDLFETSVIDGDPGQHPVTQVLFSYGDKPVPKRDNIELVASFVDDEKDCITVSIQYASHLFAKETIERLVGHLQVLLGRVSENPEDAYSRVSLLSEEEFNTIVYDWNKTDHVFPKGRAIHELFQEQVEKTPDAIAVIYEEQYLTYREVNDRSSQLARHLRNEFKRITGQELRPGIFIGLYVDRGIEMVVAALAVLKSGAAYAPIDTRYPKLRIQYLLNDTKAAVVLSQRKLSFDFPVDIIYVDFDEKLYDNNDSSNLPTFNSATDLAYVIYTSGTTGNPKGVIVEHASVVNLIYGQRTIFRLDHTLKMLQFASIVFDASVWEIFATLSFGGQLFVVPTSVRRDGHQLVDYIEKHKINLALIPPVLLSSMPWKPLEKFYKFMVGGEVCAKPVIERWSANRELINVYGPTETTVYATTHPYLGNDANNLNIGLPLPNMKAYVLDKYNLPVPVGVVGQLYIGGAGVTRGYLNNESLTREKFVTNPFPSKSDLDNGYTRLYKTGDLARRLVDGSIEYAGRNDDQVKIRGHRIELGEIEHALAQLPGIAQACVIARQNALHTGHKFLIGYYVLDKTYSAQKDAEILSTWEDVYDREYTKPVGQSAVASDFTGWNSYITGNPIPLNEMFAWRDAIIRRITNLNPKNVLEIGVGSGILMYPLVDKVNSYVGLDISKPVIERHRKNFASQSYNVKFHHLRGNQLDQLPPNTRYDTIIINSVCQHFPTIMYFDAVIEASLNLLTEGGSIFLGDVCNYDMYEELIGERLRFRGKPASDQEIKRALMKEYDLLISPNYFDYLKDKFKNVRVGILKRGEDYNNELSKYRYDVVITVTGRVEKIVHDDNRDHSVKHYNVPFLSQISKEEILDRLSEILPSFMIPDALVPLQSFPITNNGKIDKHLLPDPEFGSLEDYVRPTTEVEIAVSNIWKEVLGLERVGIEDDFFRLGGNSILATQASHRMSKTLGLDVRVSSVFELKTISRILGTTSAYAEGATIEKEF